MISQLVVDYFNSVALIMLTVKGEASRWSWICLSIDFPAYKAASGFEAVFGSVHCQYALVVVFQLSLLSRSLSGDCSHGLRLGVKHIHSPNENMPVDLWLKGIETIINFHLEYDKEA